MPAPEAPPGQSPADATPTAAEFDNEFEHAFGSAARSSTEGARAQDSASNRELFVGIASRQAKPVKSFVRQLQRGSTAKDLIGMCRPVLNSTREAAAGVHLDDVARCLTDLDEALSLAQEEDGARVDGEARDLILSCYRELESQMPEAFGLDDEECRRDTLIVHALLRQIPDVGHVTLERLYEAGFTSLDVLIQATREDLAVTTGIRPELAERICDRVQQHHESTWGVQTEQLPEVLRTRLRRENDALREAHESFEATSEAEILDASLGDRKREMRRLRQACAWQIEVTLAELEEFDRLDELQKQTFGVWIETIDGFLSKPTSASTPTQGG